MLLPTTRKLADGANEITVPEIVIAEAPGMRVCEPTMKSELETAVTGVPSIVMMDGVGRLPAVAMACVVLPTTAKLAAGAREIGVLETVMAGPPGMRVIVPATYADAEFAVKD